jgi:formylglycine-generating enzyme required for sulfatase activity
LELVLIAAGNFQRGSKYGESDEKPVTTVRISRPYWLGKYEVTQKEWTALMRTSPSNVVAERFPVEQVSWEEAMAFCPRLTERERAAGRLPAGHVYTLPTEAEWDYACRAGTTGDYSGTGKLADMGWYSANSDDSTHPVGQERANGWGLYNMHGNVWEWCRDWYASSLPGGSVTDPSGALLGSDRVIRGGSWFNTADRCRSASRFSDSPGVRRDLLGFRLALSSVR